jgi:hypothetical protein
MELKLKTINYSNMEAKPTQWNHLTYYYAIVWWRSSAYGTGHFNKELYERIVEIKNQINIK